MYRRILTAVAAVSVGLGGYLHLQIWRGGYRYAPVKEMFLLNVGLSGAIAIALLIHPSRWTAAAGLAISAGSLAAFGLSRWTAVGLPTLHGKFTETGLNPTNVRFLGGPAAAWVLGAEGLAVLCCLAVLFVRHAVPARAQGWSPATA